LRVTIKSLINSQIGVTPFCVLACLVCFGITTHCYSFFIAWSVEYNVWVISPSRWQQNFNRNKPVRYKVVKDWVQKSAFADGHLHLKVILFKSHDYTTFLMMWAFPTMHATWHPPVDKSYSRFFVQRTTWQRLCLIQLL